MSAPVRLSEIDLFKAYARSAGEPCACGGWIVPDAGDWDAIRDAVGRHNASPAHLSWRDHRDSLARRGRGR